MGAAMTDREAYIVLNMIPGIGPIRLTALCAHFGSASAALSAGRRGLCAVPGLGPELAGDVAAWESKTDLAGELHLAERAGVRIVTRVDADYPPMLAEIHDPPLCLYVRGELPNPALPTLGVVGSRRITPYGRRMAEYLSTAAAHAGWPVISGLAYGVDAVAHESVVTAGGITVAVLGGGLARIHPQDHIPLARRIAAGAGAVISEFPMTFPPSRRTFPMRNRIISGMSNGVLVIEAGVRSGALITAKTALEQGRQVFAVPGRADDPQSRGCNNLIRDGAKLTETFDDIVADFEFLPGFVSPAALPKPPFGEAEEEEFDDSGLTASSEEEKILALLAVEGECSVDRIAGDVGMPMGPLLALLMELTLKRRIEALPGKRYLLRRDPKTKE
jgi:DNA processing protein